MLDALLFLGLIEVLGLAAIPLAGAVFARIPGGGLGFAKPLGLLLATWLTWMAGSLGIPYSVPTAVLAAVLVGVLGMVVRLRGDPPDRALRRSLWIWSEVVFVVAFAGMALLAAYSPDVWFFERPMDMMFVSSVNAADTFPPHDPWMAGEDVNYYYFGHLVAAWLIRLTGVDPAVGYNLAIAAYFALTMTAVFAFSASLWAGARARATARPRSPIVVGLGAAGASMLLGNIASAAKLVTHDGPLRQFDWFNTTRVIDPPHTINEFPLFSWVLGDLHGHVMALPFTVLALAFALQFALAGPGVLRDRRRILELVLAGIAIGVLYAINSWSYPVVLGLALLALAVWARDGRRAQWKTAAIGGVVLVAVSLLSMLPFHLSFDPAAKGVGWVTHREEFDVWARSALYTVGVFLWVVIVALMVRLARTRSPWRNLAWGAAGLLLAGTALASKDLSGPLLVAAALSASLRAMLAKRLTAPERFVWLLAAGGLTCLLINDTVYVKDPFDGGPYNRMNTVFKMGFQAWLLLALASAPLAALLDTWLPRWPRRIFAGVLFALVGVSLAFPYAGTYSRKNAFSEAPHLDGQRWLARTAPGDIAAIEWLRDHTPGDAVVLESVGDDYSSFGHARISTYTGRPTVLGWFSHEIQWAHNPVGRREEVQAAYADSAGDTARALLGKYGVDYVVVGPLERTDYGDAGIPKWDRLGKRVFDRQGTTVWRVTSRA
jgi:YYY domain-containing protein